MATQPAVTTFHEHVAAMLAASKAGTDPVELKQQAQTGMLTLLQLKAAHRGLAEKMESIRQAAVQVKAQDGQSSLQLYNFDYQAAQHGKEVKTCKSFISAYPDDTVRLLSREQFIAEAPAEMNVQQLTNDEHQLMLKRLTYELHTRQQLKTTADQLVAQRTAAQQEVDAKRQVLKQLLEQLQNVAASAKGLQAGLQIEPKMHGGEEAARAAVLGPLTDAMRGTPDLLPLPLYIIYSQGVAAQAAYNEPIKVTISGNVEAAREFQGQGASDGELDVQSAASMAHPLQVTLHLLREQIPVLAVHFQYLPRLHIITAGVDTPQDVAILSTLYPGDQGLSSPNSANALLVPSGRVLEWDPDRLDRPYRWAQHLGGMDFLPSVPSRGGPAREEVGVVEDGLAMYRSQQRLPHVLKRLQERKQAVAALNAHLGKLLASPPQLPLYPTSFRNTTKLQRCTLLASTHCSIDGTTTSQRAGPRRPPAGPSAPASAPGRGPMVDGMTVVTDVDSPAAFPLARGTSAALSTGSGAAGSGVVQAASGAAAATSSADVAMADASDAEEEGELVLSPDEEPLDYLAAALAHPEQQPQPQSSPWTAAPQQQGQRLRKLLYKPSSRSYRVVFKHTEAMEVTFALLVADEYPVVVPLWCLEEVVGAHKPAAGQVAAKKVPLDKGQLAVSRAQLQVELNQHVPSRVPTDKMNDVLAYQTIALVRALDHYKTLWWGDEAAKERVPTRGPDRHPDLPISLT